MRKLRFLLALSVVGLMTSCASVSRTGVVAPFAYTEVHPNEIRAEVDLSEKNKVIGKANQWYLLGVRVSGGNKYFENNSEKPSLFGKRVKKAQSCAMYDALDGGEYDIIANPQYRNTVHNYFFGLVKGYKVSVTGYGGKVKKLYQHTEPTDYQTIQR
ncbi:hypothetical protein [Bacteroides sp. 224]|uniref:hypothetical protein n=1 Tax=Bacteroides sp. 224 TaxID=2302936 RepID=UPI0013D5863A|nr:hypothetical protein [Bacteroides sp. 224]NDV65594.1 hypothetical protein [Bacteroides sp. 224]